jgi:hypothetical protein
VGNKQNVVKEKHSEKYAAIERSLNELNGGINEIK